MNNRMPGNRLNFALNNLESLPAMPDIAVKLLALPLDTVAGEMAMLKLVSRDPQIFARVIGLANSPAVGAGRKVSSIQDAAMLLGMKRLKSVAIGIATMSKMLNQPAGKNFDPQDLWTHSMTIAIIMNAIAQEMPKRIRPDDNQIFLAGLLHDIGLMALHYLDPHASDELHRQLRLQPRRHIIELELELLGMTHCQIGAKLVRYWQLPGEIAEVVELHHSQDLGAIAFDNPLVRLVNVAEKLLPDFAVAEHTFDAIDECEWRDLCIDGSRAEYIRELANELAVQVVQLPDGYMEEHSADQLNEVVLPGREMADKCSMTSAAAPPVAKKETVKSADRSPFNPVGWLFRLLGKLLR